MPKPAPTTPPRALHFTRTNGSIDEAIDNLMDMSGGIRRPGIVREMILASLKAGQEDDGHFDLKMMNHSIKEMRFAAKIFSPYREARKVSVFGSARTAPTSSTYRMAKALGRGLAEAGFMVITGGGPGIMQAVNEGAGADASFGINIQLPFEQQPNPVMKGNPRHVNYKYFFNRKVAFIKEAHAIILLPGGFGTLDEGMETLTLLQTGKREPMPVVLMDRPGSAYWNDWKRFVSEHLVDSGHIHPSDLNLLHHADHAADAIAHIQSFYRRYYSLRYVGDRLVMRITERLSAAQVETLNNEFTDILTPGGTIRPSAALPEEQDDSLLRHLPRLLIDFDRRRFSRLRLMIDRINTMPSETSGIVS